MDRIRTAAADNDVSIWTVLENLQDFDLPIQIGAVQRIGDFVALIQRFAAQVPTLDAFTLAKQIVHSFGIIKALQEEDDNESADRINNIEELLNGVQEFVENDEGGLMSDEMADATDNSSLNTQHSSQQKTLDEFLQ